jgi:hypothetical protein
METNLDHLARAVHRTNAVCLEHRLLGMADLHEWRLPCGHSSMEIFVRPVSGFWSGDRGARDRTHHVESGTS